MIDISGLLKHRLAELGDQQRYLAGANQVTQSYISRLLTGRKALPAPNRMEIDEKIDELKRSHPRLWC